jgi:hypothetical protein
MFNLFQLNFYSATGCLGRDEATRKNWPNAPRTMYHFAVQSPAALATTSCIAMIGVLRRCVECD